MRNVLLCVALLGLLPACSTPRSAGSRAEPAPQPYVRLDNTDSNRVQLQIAVRRFQPTHGRGPTVWLAGVSHIGDPAYYTALQQHLDAQTLVLYEGITDSGGSTAGIPRNQPQGLLLQTLAAAQRSNPASLQASMASALGLVFQLEAIDYHRPNFRNSDLSIQQLRALLAQSQPSAGGSGASQGFETLLEAMDGNSMFDVVLNWGLRLLGASPKLKAMGRLTLIEVIAQIKGDPSQLHGLPSDMHQLLDVLVKKRNEKVASDLSLELRRLKPSASVALFYGTGHMPDLERRLRADLGYQPTGQQWLTAFEVNLSEAGITESEWRFIRGLVQRGFDTLPQPGTR